MSANVNLKVFFRTIFNSKEGEENNYENEEGIRDEENVTEIEAWET